MTPKDAHAAVRQRALPCPCCGAALALTAGKHEEPNAAAVNIVARRLMLEASALHDHQALHLSPIEDVAQDMIDGKVQLVPQEEP